MTTNSFPAALLTTALAAGLLPASTMAQTAAPVAAGTTTSDAQKMATPAPEMQTVLDKLAELGAKPLHTLTVEEARAQATPADAVAAVMAAQNITAGPAGDIATRDITLPGPAGDIMARVYTPPGTGPFPVIVYYHGGGWVIADLDTYDASARALA